MEQFSIYRIMLESLMEALGIDILHQFQNFYGLAFPSASFVNKMFFPLRQNSTSTCARAKRTWRCSVYYGGKRLVI